MANNTIPGWAANVVAEYGVISRLRSAAAKWRAYADLHPKSAQAALADAADVRLQRYGLPPTAAAVRAQPTEVSEPVAPINLRFSAVEGDPAKAPLHNGLVLRLKSVGGLSSVVRLAQYR